MTITEQPHNTTTSFERWLERGVHEMETVTGVTVKVRLPDLATLVARQRVPDHLRVIAAQTFLRNVKIETGIEDNPVDLDKLGELYELNMWLVAEMLVDPVLDVDQVKQLPSEDIDLLLDIALRERDTDARGRRLGVAPLDLFPDAGVLEGRAQVGTSGENGVVEPDVDGVPV